jgi:hypothetical protein
MRRRDLRPRDEEVLFRLLAARACAACARLHRLEGDPQPGCEKSRGRTVIFNSKVTEGASRRLRKAGGGRRERATLCRNLCQRYPRPACDCRPHADPRCGRRRSTVRGTGCAPCSPPRCGAPTSRAARGRGRKAGPRRRSRGSSARRPRGDQIEIIMITCLGDTKSGRRQSSEAAAHLAWSASNVARKSRQLR